MICFKTEIPIGICRIDDKLEAIYHSKDSICISIFETRNDSNRFIDKTIGMLKDEREKYFQSFYK